MSDHFDFLARQCAWGRMAFGPGERRAGVLAHIEEEINEVESAKTHDDRAGEWADIVLLAQDGLLRSVREYLREHYRILGLDQEPKLVKDGVIVVRYGEPTSDFIAQCALSVLTTKRDKNELREWGDWRQDSESRATKHKEGVHD